MMTKNKDKDVKKNKTETQSKEVNPYSLPNGAQLLAYWHYQLQNQVAPDEWNISRSRLGEFLKEGEAAALDARKRDTDTGLIKELQALGAHGSPFSRMLYVRDMRQLSKWRLIAGQKRDGCIQLDQQLALEKKRYQEIKREYKQCVAALEKFLAQDHEESMKVLNVAESELVRTLELSQRRDELSHRYGRARLEVYHWEEAWRTVKACHRFLHRVSRIAPVYEGSQTDGSENIGEGESSTLTSGGSWANTPRAKSCTQHVAPVISTEVASSLDSLIAAFEREAVGLSKSPAKSPNDLGLVDADDLLKIFRAIEMQNLNALIHLESLGGPMAEMIARIDLAEARVRNEIDDVVDGIRQLEKSIEHEEKRALRLERLSCQLVRERFRRLVCSENTLHDRVLVEDAYEQCVAVNEAGLGPLAMARALENTYERLSAELDGLPRHLVNACEREGFRQELRENREAEDAARKFALMRRLLAALRRIMEPNEPKRRMLMRRSVPAERSKRRLRLASCKITGEQDRLQHELFGKSCLKDEDASDD